MTGIVKESGRRGLFAKGVASSDSAAFRLPTNCRAEAAGRHSLYIACSSRLRVRVSGRGHPPAPPGPFRVRRSGSGQSAPFRLTTRRRWHRLAYHPQAPEAVNDQSRRSRPMTALPTRRRCARWGMARNGICASCPEWNEPAGVVPLRNRQSTNYRGRGQVEQRAPGPIAHSSAAASAPTRGGSRPGRPPPAAPASARSP